MTTPAPTIRRLPSIIGSVISLFTAIPLGRLHYRVLEREKIYLFRKALSTLSVENNVFKDNKVILFRNKTMKHTKANRPLEPLIYHHYHDNEKLCIAKCLQSYIGIRNTIVTQEVKDLVVSYGKPHKPVSSETISRCIKDKLSKAGVETSVFKAHSCRSTSSSKVRDVGVST